MRIKKLREPTVILVGSRREKATNQDLYVGRGPGRVHMLTPGIKPGQPGWLGNPFPANQTRTREQAIQTFKRAFWIKLNQDRAFLEALLQIEPRTRLVCWCKPKACHADQIAAWFQAGCPVQG